MKKFFIITILSFISASIFAQVETDPESEFIYQGRHFIPHSPWWTVGYGYGFNIDESAFEPHFLLDVHFRVMEKHYVGAGFVTSRSQFLDKDGDNIFLPHSYVKNSVNNFHILYGWRGEKLYHNYGFFIGPSLNWGFDYVYSDNSGDYHQGYSEPGIYTSLQYTRKVFYDLGVGATLWASVNKSYQVAGLSLHFYFSTALKRTLK